MTQWTTIKKVLGYIAGRKALVALSLLCAAATVGLTLYVPVLTGRAIDTIIAAGNVDMRFVSQTVMVISFIALATALAQWLMSAINNRIAFTTVARIREAAFRKLEALPLSYIDHTPHGAIVSRVIADVDQFADGLLMGFTQFFTGALTIFATIAFMFSVNVWITLAVLLVTPISLLVAAFIAKRTYDMFREQSRVRAEQTAFVEEMLTGEHVIQAFGREQDVIARFDGINEKLQSCSARAIFFSSLTNPSTRFVNALVYAIVGLAGAFSVIAGNFSVGQLTCFLSYANQYTKPFNEISGVVAELQNALACAARVFELIEAQEETPDAPHAIAPERVAGEIDIEHVSFSYDAKRRLIEDFNLHVRPGAHVAIVGPTGCGKTTLINLLMRFYDVTKGAIRLDHTDIRALTRAGLRAQIGMVLQDTWIERGTVRDNIALGKPDATMDEVIAAAKAAHADGFIRRLPQGYQTIIEQDADALSQGQRQLLSIARVMCVQPAILILDEATSSIDTRTERRVQEAFSRLTENRTSFIVAHRLSTIQNADTILVMRDGSVVEQGTHASLIAQNGFYKQLFDSQFAR